MENANHILNAEKIFSLLDKVIDCQLIILLRVKVFNIFIFFTLNDYTDIVRNLRGSGIYF